MEQIISHWWSALDFCSDQPCCKLLRFLLEDRLLPHGGTVPDEVCEVAPVLWIYVSHVPLEVLSTDLHLPLQTGLIAGILRPRGRELYVETVCGWGAQGKRGYMCSAMEMGDLLITDLYLYFSSVITLQYILDFLVFMVSFIKFDTSASLLLLKWKCCFQYVSLPCLVFHFSCCYFLSQWHSLVLF